MVRRLQIEVIKDEGEALVGSERINNISGQRIENLLLAIT